MTCTKPAAMHTCHADEPPCQHGDDSRQSSDLDVAQVGSPDSDFRRTLPLVLLGEEAVGGGGREYVNFMLGFDCGIALLLKSALY